MSHVDGDITRYPLTRQSWHQRGVVALQVAADSLFPKMIPVTRSIVIEAIAWSLATNNLWFECVLREPLGLGGLIPLRGRLQIGTLNDYTNTSRFIHFREPTAR